MATLRWFADPATQERQRCGGKGANLGALTAAGFAVPNGFVLPTDFTRSLEGPAASWPAGHLAEIEAAYRELAPGGEGVAVRSSAADEDAAGASFAGQYRSVLDVGSLPALLEAIAVCLASGTAVSAAHYRTARTVAGSSNGGMAVVVQRMVEAASAGVAFTADPLTGDGARIVVEAVRGAGEALVSGAVAADRAVLARETLAIIEGPDADGVLTAEQTRDVARQALRAEALFGAPQDIEFAFDKAGAFWMLQSRPITTGSGAAAAAAGEFDTPTAGEDHWTAANIQEVLPGMLTPLTITVFAANAARAYTEGYRRLGMLAGDENPRFVGFFHHRAFLSIDATRLVADRTLFTSGDAIEHRYLGGESRPAAGGRASLRTWSFRVRSLVPLTWLALTIHRQGAEADRRVRRLEARIRAIDPAGLSDRALDAQRRGLVDAMIPTFQVHLQTSGTAGAGFDFASRMLQPLLGDRTEAAVPALFSGLPGVESARIGEGLWDLSRAALATGIAGDLDSPGFDPLAAVLPEAWRAAFAAFIATNGHRGVHEMEPAQPSWAQEPAQVLALVTAYTALPGEQAPRVVFARQAAERERLTRELGARMPFARRSLFWLGLRYGQRWVALRERTKSAVVRGTRLVDHYLPEIQRRLVAKGVIETPGDLFFLTGEELTAALTAADAPDQRERIRGRRRAFEADRYVRLAERFSGRPDPLPPEMPADPGMALRGTPVSPGLATGRARVILDPRTARLEPGEILVAPVTDAAWTPLFALATGVVVDIGSALSHGSTVAREYGLPAVVNVRTATATIRTGDLIAVDGSTGTVTILEAASGET